MQTLLNPGMDGTLILVNYLYFQLKTEFLKIQEYTYGAERHLVHGL